MNITLNKRNLILKDYYTAVPSKSVAHRAIVCAAFSDAPTKIEIGAYGDDIKRTLDAVEKLGAKVEMNQGGFTIFPIKVDELMSRNKKDRVVIECQESGSTYRFFDEILKKLSIKYRLTGTARLIYRVTSDAPTSQSISGKLLASGIGAKDSNEIDSIKIDDNQTSLPYIELTKRVMAEFGGYGYKSPGTYFVEGGWSQASYLLAMGLVSGKTVTVAGLNPNSFQGDKEITSILERFGTNLKGIGRIDMSEIPDLVPTVASVAALSDGETIIEHIGHLRLKESDRIKAVCDMINAVGGHAEEFEDSIRIIGAGKQLLGGQVDTYGDHRIAMSAAILALGSEGDIMVSNAECVEKSFPEYWKMLGL